jgi:hypothetical protein
MRVWTDEIFELLYPENGKDELVIFAYLDESGIHGDARACVVAGFCGKKGPWRRFHTEWGSALKRFSVPSDKFRAKDVVKRQGFFGGWDEDKQRAFLNSLGEAVAAYRIYPVAYGIFVDDFLKFSLNERKFLTGAQWDAQKRKFLTSGCPSKPYIVPFVECLKVVTSHTPMGGRAHFYCGTDRALGEYATALFRYIKTRSVALNTDKLGTIGFPFASQTPPLQAADLFSYLSYSHMLERKSTGDWKTPPSTILLALLRNRRTPDDTSFRTESLIREMISVVPNLPK